MRPGDRLHQVWLSKPPYKAKNNFPSNPKATRYRPKCAEFDSSYAVHLPEPLASQGRKPYNLFPAKTQPGTNHPAL